MGEDYQVVLPESRSRRESKVPYRDELQWLQVLVCLNQQFLYLKPEVIISLCNDIREFFRVGNVS